MSIINSNTFSEYHAGNHEIPYYYCCILRLDTCTWEEWLQMIETCEKDDNITKNKAITMLLRTIHEDMEKLMANSMFTVKEANHIPKILTCTENKTLSTLEEEEILMTLGEQGTTNNTELRVS